MALSLSDAWSSINHILQSLGEINKRVALSNRYVLGYVNSVDPYTMASCEVKLIDSNKICTNVPVRIPPEFCVTGMQPQVGSIVKLSIEGEGMNPEILAIQTNRNDFMDDVNDGKSSPYDRSSFIVSMG